MESSISKRKFVRAVSSLGSVLVDRFSVRAKAKHRRLKCRGVSHGHADELQPLNHQITATKRGTHTVL